jgi:two-component system, LytTR family, response regulator
MGPIRALIVDDEPRARARLRRLLEVHSDVLVIGEAADGEQAVRSTLDLRPDVLFLDVRMPGPSGTDVAERLASYLPESVRPAVVFTTAHAEHAVQAFAVNGTDYLLKPIERDRLAEALRRVRRAHWDGGPQPPAAAPAAQVRPAVLEGHHGNAVTSVPVGAIRSIEVEDGVAFAYTADGVRTRLGLGLAELEASLPSPPFVRISRSAVVQVERVVRLHPRDSGTFEAEVEGGRRIPVSRRRARRLRELMGL